MADTNNTDNFLSAFAAAQAWDEANPEPEAADEVDNYPSELAQFNTPTDAETDKIRIALRGY